MKKGWKPYIWGIVLIFTALIIFFPKIKQIAGKDSKLERKGDRQQKVVVKVMVMKPELLRDVIKTTGTLLPDEEVDLTFEASGKIEQILFKEGSVVKRGQLLAKLNDDELKAQMGKLNIQNKLLTEKVNRQKILLEKEAISQESYDQLMTDLQSNEAEINLLKVKIDETEIHAPFDGIVGLRSVSEGRYVDPSIKVAKLIKTQPLKIEFSVPERYAGIVKEGYELLFTTENNEQSFVARVYAIEPKIDPNTRTLTLRATYPNSDGKLRPGRFVSIGLIVREKPNAIKIPSEALIPELGGEKVFLVKNNTAQSAKVRTGLRTESEIEILDGINPGDSLITSGIMQLRSDAPVLVVK
jgi:membrane fusion protein (multidrug efflux system)